MREEDLSLKDHAEITKSTSQLSKKVNRRVTLKLGAVGIGTLAGGLSFIDSKYNHIFSDSAIDTETRECIYRVIEARKSIKLDGLTTAMIDNYSREIDWSKTEAPAIENNLPLFNRSYGEYLKEVGTVLFGENAGRVFPVVESHDQSPRNLFFRDSTRSILIGQDPHYSAIDEVLADKLVHELAHATEVNSDGGVDTSGKPNSSKWASKDIYWNLQASYWEALSQTYSIDNKFFNDNQLTKLVIATGIGREVGRLYNDNRPVEKELGFGNIVKVDDITVSIAESLEVPRSGLKFNKRVCKEIGIQLTPMVLSGEIQLKGNLHAGYQKAFEGVAREVYAEMFRYAILHPDEIDRNKVVMGAIQNVVSSIRGKNVNIDSFSGKLEPSEHVMEMFAEEEKLIKMQSMPLDLQEAQIVEKVQQEIDRIEERKSDYERFLIDGRVTRSEGLNQTQFDSLTAYGSLVSTIIDKYPFVKDIEQYTHDEKFDPWLNIWTINSIEYSMRKSFIREVLDQASSAQITDANMEKINKYIKTLDWFVNDSGAFGTGLA